MGAATSKRQGRSAAAVLDFAVAQILGDDAALGALPAVLDRMVAAFGLRAALAFQPEQPAVLAVHPPGAADQALLARIGVMAMAQRDTAPVSLAVTLDGLSCTGTATPAASPVGEIGGMRVGEIGGTGEVTRARILVVEDDPEAALFLVHVLANRCRFEVIHTADPVTALRLAADEHWDLVVTDLDMPGMTGLELLGALRQLAPALPVAVVSAHVLDGTPAGLLGPADRYLEKPLRVDQLIATATALIGRGRPLSDDLRRGNLRAWL